jgi:alpha-L-fucosidase
MHVSMFGLVAKMLSVGLTAGLIAASVTGQTPPPTPFGALPSDRQLAHSHLETYAFLHFTVNTFTDREWGNGDEDPNVFNPTSFDPDQIVLALKSAGMKGAILTCKHHDGFCLWPTKTTDHNVSHSKWMNGKGDVVRALADACKRHGLLFGVYVSPWDRNNAAYGTPAYVDLYREQLKELLTHYGPLFEVWHDGANGGTGYYGGANENRSIDRRTYYGWPTTWDIVRELQPNACIFSDIGPDLRWVGNESGFAGDTSWQTFDAVGLNDDDPAPGYAKSDLSVEGTEHGSHWLPAECDVSIRPGWFWHESESGKVKTTAQLFDLYCRSVGHGASFLLNVPPDREGKLDAPDVEALKKFGDVVRETFRHNFAEHAHITASNVRGKDRTFGAQNLVSGRSDHYWSTDDDQTTPTAELDLGSSQTFDLIRVREGIELGQRVEAFAVDGWIGGQWQEIAKATSIGSCRIIRLDQPVTTSKVRLRITQCPACPVLYDFGLYLQASGAK